MHGLMNLGDIKRLWPEGTDLMAVTYTDGRDVLVLIQPPHSGHIPPPDIDGLTYMGETLLVERSEQETNDGTS